jgi:hypothetical protein
MPHIHIVAVEPIGYRKTPVLARMIDGPCQPMVIDFPIPPKEMEAEAILLQTARLACDLSLREFAALAGLTAAQVSALEWGRATFAGEDDRALYLAVLSDRTPGYGVKA